MAKVTQATLDVRIAEVVKLLLAGYTRSHIVRVIGGTYQIGIRQVDEYIKEATSQIREVTKHTAEDTIAMLTSNLWRIYRKSLRDSPNLSRQTLMDIAKLNGLDKLDITLRIDRPHQEASDDELQKAFAGDS